MSDLKYFPISLLDEALLFPLMKEEEKIWMTDLGWDYSPIRQILVSFIAQKQLPGYVAVNFQRAIGYTYFLINQMKGIIGALYASNTNQAQEAVEQLLSLSILRLKDSQSVQRIESQIMPFHNLDISAAFTQHGFSHFPRYYLDLNLNTIAVRLGRNSDDRIMPWSADYLDSAAEMTAISYRNQIDAEICEDYRTKPGCESYLRSLLKNPGCGLFMPEASFIGLDRNGSFCGLIICSRISTRVAMIPHIAVHPSYQGRGLGNSLIYRSLRELIASGFHTVSLMATRENRRALNWYQRLGFRIQKKFGAYVWQREDNCE